jgi:hypothetical protein
LNRNIDLNQLGETSKVIYGRDLARITRQMGAAQRAKLVADIRAGRITLVGLTVNQLCTIIPASPVYARAAQAMPDAERAKIDKTFRFGPYLEAKLPDAKLDKLVKTIGPGRVLTSLDRYTSPQLDLSCK